MSSNVRVLVTGSAGQVGRALLRLAPAGIEARGVDYADFDISDAEQVRAYVTQFQPQVIINTAAYTAVDKAESEPALAHRVNAGGAENFAQAALACDARLIQISTDFVFDGSASRPYLPRDATGPLSVYGVSKLAGEDAVLAAMGDKALVVRTAWVYAALGNNFVRTMLRLMNERGAVRVVADQIGTPTSAASLAAVLWRFASRADLSGIYHWTDAGAVSWYDFAVAIAEEAAARGMLQRDIAVTPIPTKEFPTPARRPAYSVLDKQATYAALDLKPVHWRTHLRSIIEEISLA